jgi:N6-adenosine-specific RNA methylase IME4
MEDMKFHPYAEIFPLIEGDEFDALVADIKQYGLTDPIVELDDMILDGRNRYRACIKASLPIQTTKYTGDDPLAYVLSKNLKRRHLTEGQRGMVGVAVANLSNGQRTSSANLPSIAVSQADAARMVGVSTRTVTSAAAVREKGTPELVERVKRGEVAVSLAAQVASLPKPEQHRLTGADEGTLRNAVKQSKRSDREVELAEATEKASRKLGTKLYSVIYSDPPWRFKPYSRDTGMDRAADNHYPTMTVERICALKIPASDNCVLFLWATVPMLPEALSVMTAWGFAYKSHCIWKKNRAGTGYWFRNMHELLLIGTRGDIPAPAPGTQYPSVIEAPLGEHSVKPAAFAEMIEELFQHLPALEMFAREPRLGWDTWGNEDA